MHNVGLAYGAQLSTPIQTHWLSGSVGRNSIFLQLLMALAQNDLLMHQLIA